MATNTIHPGAPHHLPPFITAPGETDYFYNGSAIFLVVMILLAGSLYFRLHALPERLAHKNPNKVQFQIVAVLALLALFTHNTLYWVAALLLAFVRLPDLTTPLTAIAEAIYELGHRRRRAVQERESERQAIQENWLEPNSLDIHDGVALADFRAGETGSGTPDDRPGPVSQEGDPGAQPGPNLRRGV